MENGLLEPGPFMTIRVSSRNGSYPSPVEFVDIKDEDYGRILSFIHAECGGELNVVAVRTGVPDSDHFSVDCAKCGSSIKMHYNVFCGEVSSLSVYHERWVAGAYQFVLAPFVK